MSTHYDRVEDSSLFGVVSAVAAVAAEQVMVIAGIFVLARVVGRTDVLVTAPADTAVQVKALLVLE